MATEAGAGIVTVVALYDTNNNFYPDGKTFAISTNSAVMGTKRLPVAVSIPGATDPVETADLLIVKTDEFGDLYLNLTIEEYAELLRSAGGGDNPGANLTATYIGYGGSDNKLTGDADFTRTNSRIFIGWNGVNYYQLQGNSFAAKVSLIILGNPAGGNSTNLTINDDAQLITATKPFRINGVSKNMEIGSNYIRHNNGSNKGSFLFPDVSSDPEWTMPNTTGTVIVGAQGQFEIVGNGVDINFTTAVPAGYNLAFVQVVENLAPTEHAVVMNASVSGTTLTVGLYTIEGAPISQTYNISYLLTAI